MMHAAGNPRMPHPAVATDARRHTLVTVTIDGAMHMQTKGWTDAGSPSPAAYGRVPGGQVPEPPAEPPPEPVRGPPPGMPDRPERPEERPPPPRREPPSEDAHPVEEPDPAHAGAIAHQWSRSA